MKLAHLYTCRGVFNDFGRFHVCPCWSWAQFLYTRNRLSTQTGATNRRVREMSSGLALGVLGDIRLRRFLKPFTRSSDWHGSNVKILIQFWVYCQLIDELLRPKYAKCILHANKHLGFYLPFAYLSQYQLKSSSANLHSEQAGTYKCV